MQGGQQGNQREDQSGFNQGGMYAFVFSMVFTLCFFVYICFIHKGVDLKEVAEVQPTEQTPGAEAPKEVAPKKMANIDSVKEPWIATPELIEHGHAVYLQNCQVCHGAKGLGDGPGSHIVPPPRNFVEGKWRYGGDSLTLFHTIANGSPGTSMASFGHLPKNDRWALVAFIRSITNNKVADNDAKLKAEAPKMK